MRESLLQVCTTMHQGAANPPYLKVRFGRVASAYRSTVSA
jgi:hypothetical protein